MAAPPCEMQTRSMYVMIASVTANRRIQCRARDGRRQGEGVFNSFAMGIRGCRGTIASRLSESTFSFFECPCPRILARASLSVSATYNN